MINTASSLQTNSQESLITKNVTKLVSLERIVSDVKNGVTSPEMPRRHTSVPKTRHGQKLRLTAGNRLVRLDQNPSSIQQHNKSTLRSKNVTIKSANDSNSGILMSEETGGNL